MPLFCPSACLFGAEKESDKDLIQPDQAVKALKSALVIHVGFPVLYRSVHIPGTSYAGPGSKEEGIADLKKAVAPSRTTATSFSIAGAARLTNARTYGPLSPRCTRWGSRA